VVRVNDEITVDLMTSACSVGFDEARGEIKTAVFDDVAIPYASRVLMMKTKQGLREKDQIDLGYLKNL